MEQLQYLNALRNVPGLGPVRISRLLSNFPSPKDIWLAKERELTPFFGPGCTLEAFLNIRAKLKPVDEWGKISRRGIRVTAPGRDDYPAYLAQIYNPPWILYYLGCLEGIDRSLAIVGSRHATPYGRTVAASLARDLAREGFGVVSGFARGIDTAAHQGALEAGGPTFAVFGCGLDVMYPRENSKLAAEIIEAGAIISEFPLGTQPHGQNFPARNRIISGLSLGTLVVEGKEKSGSLITADFALEQGRDVFAVPGPVNSQFSQGPHKLIKTGAKLVEGVQDIFEEYGHMYTRQQISPACFALSGSFGDVIRLLSLEPLHLDNICRELKSSPEKIAGLLVEMELAGIVRQLAGGYYVRNFL